MGAALRGRVGRHANTGAQCQNWADDQWAVIIMLNLIPVVDGGAAGAVPGVVFSGISSDGLYKAILRFQKQHFPAQQIGFIDPGSAQLSRMSMLSERPQAEPAVPKAVGQWGEFKSKTVQKALHEALKDHHYLNQVMVVEILRSVLADGVVSVEELADLKTIATKSNTIMPRSKAMLERFVAQVTDRINSGGRSFVLATSQHIYAANLVCDYLRRSGHPQWPYLDRDEVGIGLLIRLANPALIDQNRASLCGPAAVVFNMAQDRPGLYAKFAIELFENGEANLAYDTIKPHPFLRMVPPKNAISQADWLTMGSLRSSENLFMDYVSPDQELSAATTPYEIAEWLRRAGYSDVTNETNLARHVRDVDNIIEASRLYSAGYRVILFISSQMLDQSGRQGDSGDLVADRHWVVLRSPIERAGGNVKLTVYTWGDAEFKVPSTGALSTDGFLLNYYGYVSARP
jgi:hypothetical protein